MRWVAGLFALLAACAGAQAETQHATSEPLVTDATGASTAPSDASPPLVDLIGTIADAAPNDATVDASLSLAVATPRGVPPGTVLRSGDACRKDADCTLTDRTVACCPCGAEVQPRSRAELDAEQSKLTCRPKQCWALGPCGKDLHGETIDRYRAACQGTCVAIKKGIVPDASVPARP
jgi:hypothetical protein